MSVFAVTATEMMPIGLLTNMAADLHVSDGSIGLSVTLYGVVAGLLAPVWTAWTRQIDRRTLLLVIVAMFITGNAATAFVTTYTQLIVVRLSIGLLHGLMWSFVAGVAVRLVPPAFAARATALTFAGISSALVIAVPAGTAIGSWLGWRAAFGGLAILAAVAWVSVLASFPRLSSESTMRVRDVPALVTHRGLAAALAITALVVVANFTVYTYISPILTDRVGVASSSIGVYLLAYGVAGVAGNLIAGGVVARTDGRHSLRQVLVVGIGLMTAALGMLLFPVTTAEALGLIAVWGLAYSALPVVLQILVARFAPNTTDAATSLYVLTFTVSIAAGAGFGAVGIDLFGAAGPIVVGASLGVLAACVAGRALRPGLLRER